MPHVDPNVTPNPSESSPGAGEKNVQTPLDGNRADTNRVAENQNQPPQDGDRKVGADGKVYTFKEDRSDWLPPHRLREETGKRTKLETEVATLRQEIETERKRVRAALGIETPSKDEAELQETRELFFKSFPEFAHLKDLTREDIQELLEAAREARGSTEATWQRHSAAMRTELENIAAELLRTQKLSDKQSARLWRAFREEAREQAQRRVRAEKMQDPSYNFENDFSARWHRGDTTLLEEFAKTFYEEWAAPVRRTAVAAEVTRGNRPVPRGERHRSVVTQGPPNINYNDDNAFKQAIGAARTGGGEV